MKQVSVTDTAEVPDGVRVRSTEPNTGGSVNLFQTKSGNWCAQHWFELDSGQLVADYSEEQTSKADAMQDAFGLAQNEDVPFVNEVRVERDAIQVESTVIN